MKTPWPKTRLRHGLREHPRRDRHHGPDGGSVRFDLDQRVGHLRLDDRAPREDEHARENDRYPDRHQRAAAAPARKENRERVEQWHDDRQEQREPLQGLAGVLDELELVGLEDLQVCHGRRELGADIR